MFEKLSHIAKSLDEKIHHLEKPVFDWQRDRKTLILLSSLCVLLIHLWNRHAHPSNPFCWFTMRTASDIFSWFYVLVTNDLPIALSLYLSAIHGVTLLMTLAAGIFVCHHWQSVTNIESTRLGVLTSIFAGLILFKLLTLIMVERYGLTENDLPWTALLSSFVAPLLLLMWHWRHTHKLTEISHIETRILDERYNNALTHISSENEAVRVGGIVLLKSSFLLSKYKYGKQYKEMADSIIRKYSQ